MEAGGSIADTYRKTEKNMELWDVYDIARNRTGRTMVRGEKFKEGDYHLVVHICLFNDKGEMLIQQRQPFKKGFPDLWDITVGGSAVQGDDSQSAAERELLEELGIRINLRGVRPQLTVNFDCGFDDYYLLEYNVEPEDLKLQYEEVQAAKWASKEEILEMMERGEFIPYYASLIALLFDMRMKYGAYDGV